MLVLSRRIGEVLRIGDNIEVAVVSTRGGVVRLGITAPKEIAVHRQEVYERMQETTVKVDRSNLDDLADMELSGRVILDCSKLDSITSMGLEKVIRLNNRLKQERGELILRNMQPFVLEVFKVTKLDTLLKIELTESQA